MLLRNATLAAVVALSMLFSKPTLAVTDSGKSAGVGVETYTPDLTHDQLMKILRDVTLIVQGHTWRQYFETSRVELKDGHLYLIGSFWVEDSGAYCVQLRTSPWCGKVRPYPLISGAFLLRKKGTPQGGGEWIVSFTPGKHL